MEDVTPTTSQDYLPTKSSPCTSINVQRCAAGTISPTVPLFNRTSMYKFDVNVKAQDRCSQLHSLWRVSTVTKLIVIERLGKYTSSVFEGAAVQVPRMDHPQNQCIRSPALMSHVKREPLKLRVSPILWRLKWSKRVLFDRGARG